MTDKTPQQIAAEVIAAHFNAGDPETVAVIDQITAALHEAGVLIDPVENGTWQNLKAGHMTCRYEDGQLLFSLTEAGKEAVRDLINRVG